MSASRAFWDAIDQAKRRMKPTVVPDDDPEMGDYDDDVGDELAAREDGPPKDAA